MSSVDMNQLYSDIILEHNQNQMNKRALDKFTLQEHGHNPSCGDDITLQADIEGGIVKDAAYTGHGCAISQASADMMIDLIKGKSVKEALRTIIYGLLAAVPKRVWQLFYVCNERKIRKVLYKVF